MTILQAIDGQVHHLFLPKDLIRFSLPYRSVDSLEWIRSNGTEEYIITAGRIVDARSGQIRTQLPTGKVARQILLWCCTQAKLRKSKTIQIPSSLKAFVQDLGLSWNQATGKEVSNQFQALINCSLQIIHTELIDGERKVEYRKLLIAKEATLWFVDGDLSAKKRSEITLSDELYEQIKSAVPVDKAAYYKLHRGSKSPLALDVYLWLCLRLYGRSKSSRVTWKQLHEQFGSQMELKHFKVEFRKALAKALEVYPEARILECNAKTKGGFEGFLLKPSPRSRERIKAI